MNSINWSVPNIWVFLAKLLEHCSANTKALVSNPVEALKIFFELKFCNCLHCDYNCDDHISISLEKTARCVKSNNTTIILLIGHNSQVLDMPTLPCQGGINFVKSFTFLMLLFLTL